MESKEKTKDYNNYIDSQEILEITQWLLNSDAVVKITGDEFKKNPDKDLVTQVNEFYKIIGGEVERIG